MNRELTPSKISAWMECGHYLTMDRQLAAGTIEIEHRGFGEFARLVMDKGQEHEQACLEHYRSSGLEVVQIPQRGGDTFEGWIARLRNPLDTDANALYQVPLAHDGMRGIADFLVRVDGHDGTATWEPVDAKLARVEAKPGHVMQLCFYAEAIEVLTGRAPENLHLWLGSGEIDHIPAASVMPYWRRLRRQLKLAMDNLDEGADTVPVPCDHCSFCHFNGLCEERWRGEDALHYVAGTTRRDTASLTQSGIATVAGLASADPRDTGLRPERAELLALQAQLQVEARDRPDHPVPVALLSQGAGLSLLPEPDDGDIFLDFEGHPFWRPDRGLFFLFGYVARAEDTEWRYHALWAHDEEGEATITQRLIDVIAERRARHPGMHVYHYNHTERSSLDRLAAEHATRERLVSELIETGCFVDLFEVVRHSLQAGVESYGLKHLEVIAGYERDHVIDKGSGAVVEFERYRADEDPARLERIARYNEDDVRATLVLRDWLISLRPDGLEWRPAVLEVEEMPDGLDEQVERLLATHDPANELLAHVIGYWLREFRAHRAPLLAKSTKPVGELIDDPLAITGLDYRGTVQAEGKQKASGALFEIPDQELAPEVTVGKSVVFTTQEGLPAYASIRRIAPPQLELAWGEKLADVDPPRSVVFNDWIGPKPKPDALHELAAALLDGGRSTHATVGRALLLRELPRIEPVHRPVDGTFSDDLDASKSWVRHLDSGVLAIQGPPGTGKTFRGSHIIKHLINEGLRVGVTATSYAAIDNLVEAVCEVFEEADDDSLRAVRKKSGKNAKLEAHGVAFGENPKCGKPEFNLVAGTSWLFAGSAMLEHPVDVLVIDEAGQYALADALAALRSARNLLLLGDPLQLPHVSQASHPHGSGASVLAHVLGNERTMPSDRGIFLSTTWRMHPDVCGFISDQIYEGKLTTDASCDVQSTEAGTGLRWLSVEHTGNQTESPQEATAIADEIDRLLGMSWTNQKGQQLRLGREDVMVVAPYNDQVRLLRRTLDGRSTTRGVPVGTVDKFQGQEAVVVFFSMTTSSYDNMPRGPEFLFSPNRLNVAISRARCLAYLVSTEEILNSRARNVADMTMISNLCAFVEQVVEI